jgi:hypothetical protein
MTPAKDPEQWERDKDRVGTKALRSRGWVTRSHDAGVSVGEDREDSWRCLRTKMSMTVSVVVAETESDKKQCGYEAERNRQGVEQVKLGSQGLCPNHPLSLPLCPSV